MKTLSFTLSLMASLFLAVTPSQAAESPPHQTAALIEVKAPATVFTVTEPLLFALREPDLLPLRWELKDWHGKSLKSGEWPEKAPYTLELNPLPTGYYQLFLSSEKDSFEGFGSFTIVADPATRARNPDTYFAMDTAQSWLARLKADNSRFPGPAFEVVSEAVRRAGLEIIRERLRWADVEPEPGQYQWGDYELNARLLQERGVQILGMYHDAPNWAKSHTRHLPGDLLAAHRFAKQLAQTFQGKMSAWEFWNEPDIAFTSEGAWDFASAMKAAYLGFKAADPDMPVVLGGIAHSPLPAYTGILMENDLGNYMDIFAVHTYYPLHDFPGIMQNVRKFMKKYEIAEMPLWFTENGSHAEGHGRQDSYMPGLKAHSPEQELLVAEYLPKSMIYLQSMGVDRNFFFVFCPYNEQAGAKDWGLMRHDYSLKPSYAALATLTENVGLATYEGTLDIGEGMRAFLYRQKDNSQTLAYWSLSELDTEPNGPERSLDNLHERSFSLTLPEGIEKVYHGRDCAGLPFEQKAEAGKLTLSASRFPFYINGLSGLTPTQKAETCSEKPQTIPLKTNPALQVVYRTELGEAFKMAPSKDRVEVLTEEAAFKLQIYNFSAETQRGQIEISGGKTSQLPPEITLPPMSKTELELTFSPEFEKGSFETTLQITGKWNGYPSSKLLIPVLQLERALADTRRTPLPHGMNPEKWRANSSGSMKIAYDETESALTFQTSYPPNVDRWSYPAFPLDASQLELENVRAISFEIKSSTAEISQAFLIPVLQGRMLYLHYDKPTTRWEQKVIFLNEDTFDPSTIQEIQIGFNPTVDEVSWSLRNLKLIYGTTRK
ncbi:MAG: hypothetical protein QM428_02300 [Verrucomicrobiota bacterium]|jgi:hypothetical protein|nr:hypothetical protein [Verrucomicrobiota bacterium]